MNAERIRKFLRALAMLSWVTSRAYRSLQASAAKRLTVFSRRRAESAASVQAGYFTLLLLVLAFPHLVQAEMFSFTGTLGTDDQVQFFDLTLASDTTVTFQSLGYGGGTNAASTVVDPGGFDSFFTWFDAAGNQIGTNDDGCGSAGGNNGACLDAYVQNFLSAGSYILVLTQSGNSPNGDLSDGFALQGAGNFTCPQGFCDTFGNQDNGDWAVDIGGVDSAELAASPEPVTFVLTLSGFFLLGLAHRRRIH